MSITTGDLIKAHDRLQKAQKTATLARGQHELCHSISAHVLALVDHHSLWPKTFNSISFVELQVELGLLDSALELMEKEFKSAERACRAASDLLNEDMAFLRLNQTPPVRNGTTIDQAFDAEILNVQVHIENGGVLYDGVVDHARTVTGMLGL